MGFLAASIWKDLRRRLADPAAQLVWIGLPIVFGGLMSFVVGNGGPAPKAHVLVVDDDRSLLSGLVSSAGRQGQLGEFLEIENVTAEAATQRSRRAKPALFSSSRKAFRTGFSENSRPSSRSSPTRRSAFCRESSKMACAWRSRPRSMRSASSAHRFATSLPTATSTTGFPTDDRVAGISRRINQTLQRLEGTLVPPAITVETRTETSPTANFQFGPMFMPGLLFMSLLLVSQSISADIWIEKEKGTLRRAISTPRPLFVLLAGKIASAAALMLLVAIVAVAIGVIAFDVALTRVPGAIVWAAFAGTALVCYFMFLQMLGSTPARREHADDDGRVSRDDDRRRVLPVRDHAAGDGRDRPRPAERHGGDANQGAHVRPAGAGRVPRRGARDWRPRDRGVSRMPSADCAGAS